MQEERSGMWSEGGGQVLQAGHPAVIRRANSWRELGAGGATNTFGVPVDSNWLSNYGSELGPASHHPTGQVYIYYVTVCVGFDK